MAYRATDHQRFWPGSMRPVVSAGSGPARCALTTGISVQVRIHVIDSENANCGVCTRYRFGVAGSGRLSAGLYILFLEKWLEHFAPEQFLVLRMEDYHADPGEHMHRIFNFLGLSMPPSWEHILENKIFNENKFQR
jgi:hypothetical protein